MKDSVKIAKYINNLEDCKQSIESDYYHKYNQYKQDCKKKNLSKYNINNVVDWISRDDYEYALIQNIIDTLSKSVCYYDNSYYRPRYSIKNPNSNDKNILDKLNYEKGLITSSFEDMKNFFHERFNSVDLDSEYRDYYDNPFNLSNLAKAIIFMKKLVTIVNSNIELGYRRS